MTEIQEKTISKILDGKNIVAQAQTGTGKTGAFGIPIVEKIDTKNPKPQALILTPTRELAIQVSDELKKFGKYKRLFTLTLYGGTSIDRQKKFLKFKKNHIVVGTAGRIRDLIERGVLKLDNIKFFVLDEADRMLDMGFREDIEFIFSQIPTKPQILLFSATMPKSILKLVDKFIGSDYEFIRVKPEEVVVDKIDQLVVKVKEENRYNTLKDYLNKHSDKKTIIFSETKIGVEELYKKLKSEGFKVGAIHGDYKQAKREKILKDFRRNNLNILVATDVASRGLDIKDISLVINYQLPNNPESYVHRIGRTGRAGKEGLAISLYSFNEYRYLKEIKNITKGKVKILNKNNNKK
jgi:ATP-dependent RNA helicase DeaD